MGDDDDDDDDDGDRSTVQYPTVTNSSMPALVLLELTDVDGDDDDDDDDHSTVQHRMETTPQLHVRLQ